MTFKSWSFIDDVKQRDKQRQTYRAQLYHVAGFLEGLAHRLEDQKSDIVTIVAATINDCRDYSRRLRELLEID